MNDRAILSLISDLYEQVTAYQRKILELEEELAELRARVAEPEEAAGERGPAPPGHP